MAVAVWLTEIQTCTELIINITARQIIDTQPNNSAGNWYPYIDLCRQLTDKYTAVQTTTVLSNMPQQILTNNF